MDALPPPKFQGNRQWRFNSRKRRRSGTENSEGNSICLKSGSFLTFFVPYCY